MGLFSDIYIFMKSLLDLKVQRGLFVAKLLHEIYATGIVCTNPSCYHRAGIKSRSAKYGDQARSCYKILWRKAGDPATSFVIQSGSLTTLLGPSGCGKTTLLRMIAGLETPDSGEIWFENRCVFSSEKKINIPPEKRGLGFVFQDFASGRT